MLMLNSARDEPNSVYRQILVTTNLHKAQESEMLSIYPEYRSNEKKLFFFIFNFIQDIQFSTPVHKDGGFLHRGQMSFFMYI